MTLISKDDENQDFPGPHGSGHKPRSIFTEPYKSVPIETVDAVVIGAGVVGIAVARELAVKLGREVLVIESGPTFGTGSSSRNSEVIHAGIYYPRNSLKNRVQIGAHRNGWDAVVIGAGVVGIAVARELAVKLGREVLVIESGPTFGTGSSSRNSEVIHAGIYYPRNSLKIGKLIVATRSSEIPKLTMLMNRGIENGVESLRMMEGQEAKRSNRNCNARKALLSPASGIVGSHSLMLSLLGEAENHGAVFSYSTTVIGGKYEENRLQLYVSESKTLKNWDGKSPPKPDLILSPRIVVNSAGLGALALSRRFHGLDDGIIPRPYFARGCYFTFDYSVAGDRVNRFYPEIRKYYPCLKDGALEPGYAGIRPKLSGAMQGPTDFIIQHNKRVCLMSGYQENAASHLAFQFSASVKKQSSNNESEGQLPQVTNGVFGMVD
ncbi:hypothetical protein DH2020_041379 [Rehmannia glutinosa]|uniref:L-2-hydroxyglutarate dehydrogenase, mitochondrial n=1 Tax=Rehmannia glutinosa TaxID=99300 RepID=A0ABR0URH7_REHGL